MWLGCVGALVLSFVLGTLLTKTFDMTVFAISSLIAALLSMLAIPFFLAGLSKFKVELRKAYVILCIGIGLFGLSQLQLPVISIFNLLFWLRSGIVALPYLVSVVCIFWGMRTLSRLLNIESRWGSVITAIVACIVASVTFSLMPHVTVAMDEASYDISVALTVCISVFTTFAAVLAFKVRQRVGLAYINAMSWLFRALAMVAFSSWSYALTQLLFTDGDWYTDYSIAVIPFAIGAFLFVIAGYTFGSIAHIQKSSDTLPSEKAASVLTPSQELEVALYVVNLVSNPADISETLTQIRAIVARTQADHLPSLEDQKTLHTIYGDLETYLSERDPLRVLTPQELRHRIANRFGFSDIIKTNLWDKDQ